jgi:hypothetical protein
MHAVHARSDAPVVSKAHTEFTPRVLSEAVLSEAVLSEAVLVHVCDAIANAAERSSTAFG